jgi:Dyp-type peroxidase family
VKVPTEPLVDQSDLQGNVLCGYGNAFEHALYAFVHVHDGLEARRWLGELRTEVTNAKPWGGTKHPTTLNVALTCDGMRAIGVPEGLLSTFPEDFRLGMTRYAKELGDVGASAPQKWEEGLRPGRPHVLVTVTAQKEDTLERRHALLRARIDDSGGALTLAHQLRAGLLDHPGPRKFGREHFGFADGLAQPAIADPKAGPWDRDGRGAPTKGGEWEPLAPGEFVLGYPDEDGVEADAPAEPLRRSGSYMVVRKLHQDVAAFTRYLREEAGGDPDQEEFLAAKIVGRWRDGTPVMLSPGGADERFAPGKELFERINDFRYDSDPKGLVCPLGAHIRRANPRDALGWEGKLTKRHRIIRRGMPYGPKPKDPARPDRKERGLMFICYQASIRRQFEFIQSRWLHDGDAFDLGDEKDCLMGPEEPGGKVTINGNPPIFLSPPPSFITTRGGGYFFTPGIAALRELADGLA